MNQCAIYNRGSQPLVNQVTSESQNNGLSPFWEGISDTQVSHQLREIISRAIVPMFCVPMRALTFLRAIPRASTRWTIAATAVRPPFPAFKTYHTQSSGRHPRSTQVCDETRTCKLKGTLGTACARAKYFRYQIHYNSFLVISQRRSGGATVIIRPNLADEAFFLLESSSII